MVRHAALGRIVITLGVATLAACSSPGGDPPAANGIVDLDPPRPVWDDFVRDDEVGIERSRTRLLVMLDPDATSAVTSAVVSVAAEAGATVVGGAPELGAMLLALPSGAGVEAIPALRERVGAVPGVAVATEDWTLGPDELPAIDPGHELPSTDFGGVSIPWTWEREPAGGNAWLEQVRAPQAWNWNDAIERAGTLVAVGVLDGDLVWASHEELAGRVTTMPLPGDTDGVHATNVGGVIAASASDRAGLCGISPFARLTSMGLGMAYGGLASTGDLILRGFRQLVRHAPVRVINMSLGFNWRARQMTTLDSDAQGLTLNFDPPSERPAQQRIVREAGLIAARMAKHLANLAAPVMIVSSAGNDGLDQAKVSPGATPEQLAHAARWERPEVRWNNPFCWAASEAQSNNVVCVESVKTTAVGTPPVRSTFTTVGGLVSAPGEAVTTTTVCTTPACSRTSAGYRSPTGTSFSSPQVAGLIAHMLAFAPDADLATIRSALVESARPSEAGSAPQIDAGQAMRRLPGAFAALFDVDDGTVDGLDMRRFDDTRGDGEVDMSDFRRVRDTILWDRGQRDGLIAGDPSTSTKKRDHNRDGVVSDEVPEVWSRFDFNDDGIVSELDLDALGTSEVWNDPQVPGAALAGLVASADLVLDLDDFWRTGAKSVRVSADNTAYTRVVRNDELLPFIYTVNAGTLTLTVTVVEGPPVEARPKVVSVVAGQDLEVKLRRKRTPGPPCPVTQGVGGTEVLCDLGDDLYVVDPTSISGCFEASYCDGPFVRESIWWSATGQVTSRYGVTLPEPITVGAETSYDNASCADAGSSMERACGEGVCGTDPEVACNRCDGLRIDGPATVLWAALPSGQSTCSPPNPEEYSRGSVSFTLVSCAANDDAVAGCE
ncbi:MAG: S8 family serine peptidase [Deltaproteobacteria bacterium]|nr:S8 family serine peptidase [Deltaproteobacteria bacterium]